MKQIRRQKTRSVFSDLGHFASKKSRTGVWAIEVNAGRELETSKVAEHHGCAVHRLMSTVQKFVTEQAVSEQLLGWCRKTVTQYTNASIQGVLPTFVSFSSASVFHSRSFWVRLPSDHGRIPPGISGKNKTHEVDWCLIF